VTARRRPAAEPGDVDPAAMFTPGEVAELFGVGPKTVSRWHRLGRLPATFTLGGQRRFLGADVARCLAEARSRTRGTWQGRDEDG
jgi:excisionase family DNA binding protein